MVVDIYKISIQSEVVRWEVLVDFIWSGPCILFNRYALKYDPSMKDVLLNLNCIIV